MKKIKNFVAILAILCFLGCPLLSKANAATIATPSGKSFNVTKAQIEVMKTQPGVQFSSALPAQLPAGQVAVSIPAELGGGYIIGTPAAVANAFNEAGITTGLTAAGVAGLSTAALIGLGVLAVIALALIVDAALEDEDEVTTTTHHAATHHAATHHAATHHD